MIYLKAANLDDAEKEYDFIRQLPEDENGAYIHHEDEKEFFTRIKRVL